MVGLHYVMIATSRAKEEATHVVRVQLDYSVRVDIKFLGISGRQLIVDVGESVCCGWFGLGGAHACLVLVMLPFRVSTDTGQYFAALV